MTPAAESPPLAAPTLADLLAQLGDVPPSRVRATPPPGSATEEDLLKAGGLYELVDGVLVEKAMGYRESLLAAVLIRCLGTFVRAGRLGVVLGADGMLRLLPRLVRAPDACFISWSRFPGGRQPTEPLPAVVPDLAVEVLSPSNTPGEMQRKLREYLAAGVRLIWYIDPATRTASVYDGSDEETRLGADDVLTGGAVLPGFELPLRELFAEMDEAPSRLP